MQVYVDQMRQMNTRQRIRKISFFLHLLTTSGAASKVLTQPDFEPKDNYSDMVDQDDSSDLKAYFDLGVYEFVPVLIFNEHGAEFVVHVLSGCSLVSLSDILASAGMEEVDYNDFESEPLKKFKVWRLKHTIRTVQLYVKYHDAVAILEAHGDPQAASTMITWLMASISDPPPNSSPDNPQKVELLEAINREEYVITLFPKAPEMEKGNLVLLRASNGEVHLTSFTRACFGLPLRKRDVRDDHECLEPEYLKHGPMAFQLILDQTIALWLSANELSV